jgi:hypothetical protein
MSEERATGNGQELSHRDAVESRRSSWLTRREDKARRLERVAILITGLRRARLKVSTSQRVSNAFDVVSVQ